MHREDGPLIVEAPKPSKTQKMSTGVFGFNPASDTQSTPQSKLKPPRKGQETQLNMTQYQSQMSMDTLASHGHLPAQSAQKQKTNIAGNQWQKSQSKSNAHPQHPGHSNEVIPDSEEGDKQVGSRGNREDDPPQHIKKHSADGCQRYSHANGRHDHDEEGMGDEQDEEEGKGKGGEDGEGDKEGDNEEDDNEGDDEEDDNEGNEGDNNHSVTGNDSAHSDGDEVGHSHGHSHTLFKDSDVFDREEQMEVDADLYADDDTGSHSGEYLLLFFSFC